MSRDCTCHMIDIMLDRKILGLLRVICICSIMKILFVFVVLVADIDIDKVASFLQVSYSGDDDFYYFNLYYIIYLHWWFDMIIVEYIFINYINN